MTFKLGQFYKRCLNHQSLNPFENYIYPKFHSNFPGANELKIKSNIQINKIQYLNYNQLTHSSKAILEDIKGNGGSHSCHSGCSTLQYQQEACRPIYLCSYISSVNFEINFPQ